ncbi:MAG: ferrous iron transport protein B [Stanieria sp.]
MNCHSGKTGEFQGERGQGRSRDRVIRIVLVGMPNTGKSTFFNRLTGSAAAVGNWPGMTVSFLQAQLKIDGKLTELVDLPGIYDLNGYSDDEKVVRHFFENFPIDLVIVVLNASQIDRQICLPLQIKALGLPAVVILNMADEAEQYGVQIDTDKLSKRLGMSTVLISAKYGKGYTRAYREISYALKEQQQSYQIDDLQACLNDCKEITPEQMRSLLTGVVTMPEKVATNLTTRLDRILLDPVLGLPLFFLGMFLVFSLIWNIGLPAQGLVGDLTDWLQQHLIEPLLQPFPEIVQNFFIEGIWNGLATVVGFVPLIVLFFILMAILEDSGYLSRSAYLMDALMARLGLDGRSFVMQMMGFGCNVPALMGTRVMRSQALRLLTMLIIPFSLCSARLQVFVFIIAAVFAGGNGAIVLFSLYLLSFVAAIATAALFQGVFKNDEPFVLELPPYRFPTWKQVIIRGWGEVKHFLTRASGFITLGCIAVWAVTNLPPGATGLDTIGGQMGKFLAPVMSPLGIDPYLTLALIFGFVAKEVVVGSLAVIYGLNSVAVSSHITQTVSFIQGYSFCIFCLLYTPCLTTVATLLNESKSWKFTLFSLGFSLVLAWVASFCFYQTALLLGFR